MSPNRTSRQFSEACELLGVRKLATQSEIRAAWRRKAFETHPDRPAGSAEAFNRVNAAYELLKPQAEGKRWNPPEKPQFARQDSEAKWHRPRVTTNLLRVTTQIASLCRSSLSEVGCNRDDAQNPGPNGFAHIPHSIRQRGRQVSYIVQTPLRKGANRVALPTGELSGHRDAQAEVIDLDAESEGQATIEVPEALRNKKFPGARRVRIHFAQS